MAARPSTAGYSRMHECPVSAARVAVALSRESKRVVNEMQQGESGRETDDTGYGRTRPLSLHHGYYHTASMLVR